MQIEYVKGSLFDTHCRVIAHGVNCLGIMGSGVAAKIKFDYSKVCQPYVKHCQYWDKDPNKLGGTNFVVEDEYLKTWVNMFTQADVSRTHRTANYEYVYQCFEKMRPFLEYHKAFAMPFIGCGLGGGSWKIVKAIIEKTLGDIDGTIYIYYIDEEEYKAILVS